MFKAYGFNCLLSKVCSKPLVPCVNIRLNLTETRNKIQGNRKKKIE
jgi:hypothetical protein